MKPGAKSDNKVVSYKEFTDLIGEPLLKSKNNNKLILQNTLESGGDAEQAIKPSSTSAVEHIDAGDKPSPKDKVAVNVEAAGKFSALTCEEQ
jgi:hypothetical protein